MLFNSIEFAIFLPLVFILYWFVFNKNLRLQNLFLLCTSYVFYGWWDYRFLSLIIISSLVDYIVGIQLSKNENNRKRVLFLLTSIFVNLGLLGFFKYYNFFLDSFQEAFTFFGKSINVRTLKIILPVGISFYTFQTLSYSIDIYRKKMQPTRNIITFFAYVSFFPQLVAGPIERAINLIPQFEKYRVFDQNKAIDGLRQILWGLFKKIVIADNCATIVNEVFSNSNAHSGSELFLGVIFFAFQIYGDFSGYSDIAIGSARLFGFNLMRNFAFPYFSRDIAEFWRRWHISLSSWFRDYLYIPLGGSRGPKSMQIRNTLIIFLVSGFWHGANWTFIIWGFLNALYFIPLMILKQNRKNIDTVAQGRFLPSIREFLEIAMTFTLTTFAWIFFRAQNLHHAISYIAGIISKSLFTFPAIEKKLLVLIFLFMTFEWIKRNKNHALEFDTSKNVALRWLLYIVLVVLIFTYSGTNQQFIYFQF